MAEEFQGQFRCIGRDYVFLLSMTQFNFLTNSKKLEGILNDDDRDGIEVPFSIVVEENNYSDGIKLTEQLKDGILKSIYVEISSRNLNLMLIQDEIVTRYDMIGNKVRLRVIKI